MPTIEDLQKEVDLRLWRLNKARTAEGKNTLKLISNHYAPRASKKRGEYTTKKIVFVDQCVKCNPSTDGIENKKGASALSLRMAIFDCLKNGISIVGILTELVEKIEDHALTSKTPEIWRERSRAVSWFIVEYRKKSCTQRSTNG